MAVNKSLVWILAGAALASLGAAAFWLWRRHETKPAAVEETEAEAEPEPEPEPEPKPEPADDGPKIDIAAWAAAATRPPAEQVEAAPQPADGHRAQAEAEPVAPEAQPTAEAEPAPAAPSNEGPKLEAVADADGEAQAEQPKGAHFVRLDELGDDSRNEVRKVLRRRWDGRKRGRELDPETGDDIALVAATRVGDSDVILEVLLARTLEVREEVVAVEVIGSAHGKGARVQPMPEHGVQIGDQILLQRSKIAEVAKAPPPPTLIPKKRKRRYKVSPEHHIVLKTKDVAESASVRPSREDVAVKVVERNPARMVVCLDGPAGEVNLALVVEDGERERPVTSWKFELVEGAAA